MKRLLIIDDEELIVDSITMILESFSIDVDGATDPHLGLSMALDNDYDLILSDLRMPGKNGAEIAREIMAAKPDSRILIITAFPMDPIAQEALDAGAFGLIKKPFEIAKIIDLIGKK